MNSFKEYKPEELLKLQETEKEILYTFDKICREHNWSYFLCGGSAIGVIRHGGFIPWDDDVDVLMPRDDYEAFIDYFSENAPDPYSLLRIEKDRKYVYTFAKICKNGTKFLEKASDESNYNCGIFIDIFPYDSISTDENIHGKMKKKAWMYRNLCMSNIYWTFGLDNSTGIKKAVVAVSQVVTHFFMKLFGIRKIKIYEKFLSVATAFNNSDTGLYTNFSDAYDIRKWLIFSKDEIFPLRRMKFMDIEVNVMNKYDTVLTRQFGDYMQLPPESSRVNHCPQVLDFGE